MNATSKYVIRRYEGGYLSYLETPDGKITHFMSNGQVYREERREPDGSIRFIRGKAPSAEAVAFAEECL